MYPKRTLIDSTSPASRTTYNRLSVLQGAFVGEWIPLLFHMSALTSVPRSEGCRVASTDFTL